MTTLHIDFESRSTIDLRKVGLHVYANHPTTDVICMGFAFGDRKVQVWDTASLSKHEAGATRSFLKQEAQPPEKWDDEPPWHPLGVWRHVQGGGTVYAHNASFEIAIWNTIMVKRYGWPPLTPEQTFCTAAMARAMGLPGDLERAAPAAGLDIAKDGKGHRLMLQMCKPREVVKGGCPRCGGAKWLQSPEPSETFYGVRAVTHDPCPDCHGTGDKIIWWDDEERLGRLYDYCKTDVEVERQLEKRLMPLSRPERKLWLLDYAINERGVYCDTNLARKAQGLTAMTKDLLDDKLAKITGGWVSRTTNHLQLSDWVRQRGVECPGVAKEAVTDLLARGDLPQDVREALVIRQESAKSSTAKFVSMVNRASADGWIRGMFMYCGASTGRWAAYGVQLHNLPRPTLEFEEILEVIEILNTRELSVALETIDAFYGPPLAVMASIIRAMLCAPPGSRLIAMDFSAIEACVLAWLAGEAGALKILFGDGKLYEHAAASIYGVLRGEIAKKGPRRQVGKVAVLALGYGGGIGAFATMAAGYGVDMEEVLPTLWAAADWATKKAAIGRYRSWKKTTTDKKTTREAAVASELTKLAWRKDNPSIVSFWRELEDAAVSAMENPGVQFTVRGRITYRKAGSFLWCRLPSGRVICYPYPEMRPKKTPWDTIKNVIHYKEINAKTRQWQNTHTYGGKLAENVVQAVARDLLAEGMLAVDRAGYNVVLHIHDELVVETPDGQGSLEEVADLMSAVPGWAEGCPISVEGWEGERYRK